MQFLHSILRTLFRAEGYKRTAYGLGDNFVRSYHAGNISDTC